LARASDKDGEKELRNSINVSAKRRDEDNGSGHGPSWVEYIYREGDIEVGVWNESSQR